MKALVGARWACFVVGPLVAVVVIVVQVVMRAGS